MTFLLRHPAGVSKAPRVRPKSRAHRVHWLRVSLGRHNRVRTEHFQNARRRVTLAVLVDHDGALKANDALDEESGGPRVQSEFKFMISTCLCIVDPAYFRESGRAEQLVVSTYPRGAEAAKDFCGPVRCLLINGILDAFGSQSPPGCVKGLASVEYLNGYDWFPSSGHIQLQIRMAPAVRPSYAGRFRQSIVASWASSPADDP